MRHLIRILCVWSLVMMFFFTNAFSVLAGEQIIEPKSFIAKPSIMYSTTDSQSNDQDSEALSE